MSILSRININSTDSHKLATIPIQLYLSNNPTFSGYIYTDCYENVHIDNKKYVPQLFNNNIVFISTDSFQQNHKILSIKIRKYINSLLCDNITCFGGESYLYALINKNIKDIYHYTNSKSIYNDCIFNQRIYGKYKNITNNLVNYNTIIPIHKTTTCLINLSCLNSNLIKQINKIDYNHIIIINCHHDDFWKKTKSLTNYKLVLRKKFICNKLGYFITVNLFYSHHNFL